jgi:NADPH2:quinone reductase
VSRVVRVHNFGGPEELTLEERAPLEPRDGQVIVRNAAIGLNYVDVYNRNGLYKSPLPMTLGTDGAGTISVVGGEGTGLRPGDRVLYLSGNSYADEVAVPAGRVVKLPDELPFDIAATLPVKATTAYYLLFETTEVKPGDIILVHAAAGGAGTFLVQWGSALGATVIALAGSAEKVELAKQHGAAFAFNSREEGWVAKVREAAGRGVDVVYDGVGRATFEQSLDCLRPRGLMVSYGNASGPVTGVNLGILSAKGSLYLTRPTGNAYTGTREGLVRAMDAVFDAIRTGKIRPTVNQRFQLANIQEAHRALEARETTGSSVILP